MPSFVPNIGMGKNIIALLEEPRKSQLRHRAVLFGCKNNRTELINQFGVCVKVLSTESRKGSSTHITFALESVSVGE